ncbi:hypothetical protein OROGR_007452 [Orobanche gracilis]
MANHVTMLWNYLIDVLCRQPDSRESPLGQLLLGPLLVPFTVRLCRFVLVPIDQQSWENATWILRNLIVHTSYAIVHDHLDQVMAEILLEELQAYGVILLDDPRDDARECGEHIVVGSVVCSIQQNSEWVWFTHFYGEGFTRFPHTQSNFDCNFYDLLVRPTVGGFH